MFRGQIIHVCKIIETKTDNINKKSNQVLIYFTKYIENVLLVHELNSLS